RYRQTPPDRLFMLIGDVLHNLRSALDHLAWSLAGTLADRNTEFPIFVDPARFGARDGNGRPERGGGLRKLHNMPAEAQSSVRNASPSPISMPSAASKPTSRAPIPSKCEKGASTAIRSICARQAPGAIDTSLRWRAITIEAAKASIMTNATATPS